MQSNDQPLSGEPTLSTYSTMQSVNFNYRAFSYSIRVVAGSNIAPGCDASQIRYVVQSHTLYNHTLDSHTILHSTPLRSISPLYMENTCLSPPNNNQAGCPGGNTNSVTVSGTLASSGSRVPVNSTTSLCNQAISTSSMTIASASSQYYYTQGTVSCSPTTNGFFFIQNNCPDGNPNSVINIQIDYTPYYGNSCNGYNYNNGYYYRWTWPAWATWVIVGSIVLFTILTIIGCIVRRRRYQQAYQVQMMQMGPPPPPPPMGNMPPLPQYGGVPPPQYGGSAPPPGYPPIQQQPGVATGEPIWYAGGKPPQNVGGAASPAYPTV